MKSNTIQDITTVLKQNEKSLQKNYNVAKIGVFGSAVRSDFRINSDIDLVIDLKKPIGFFKFLELEEFLSQALGRKVDLVTRGALKSIIKQEILNETIYV